MRIWVDDFKHHLSLALRAVGVGLGAVAWASVLGSEGQLSTDLRAYAQVGAAVLSVCIAQWRTALPPSANPGELLRPLERDILTIARQRAGGDPAQAKLLAARITDLAAERINRGATMPRDRRAWLRALAQLADGPTRG
jgi:hypothetical protein